MRALIFGVNGQDGSYLAEFLLEKGYEVTGVIRRSSVDTGERIKHIKGLKVVEGDIADYVSVHDIITADYYHEIYNLAAQSHVGTSFNQPFLTTNVDYIGVLNILEVIRKCAWLREDVRFYQASTSEMFGDQYTGRREDDEFGNLVFSKQAIEQDNSSGKKYYKYQDETTPFAPRSPYAVAKMAAHHAVNTYRDAYGLHASCGILFNHESPRRGELFVTRKITKWLANYNEWILKRIGTEGIKNLDKYIISDLFSDDIYIAGRINREQNYQFPKLRLGNMKAYRDWGHAKDYVRAMWLMLQQEKPDDYVIATGKSYSVEDFVAAAFKVFNIDNWSDFVVVDPQLFRPAEVEYLLGKAEKAKCKLGWEPEITFDELVKEMVLEDVKKARSLEV